MKKITIKNVILHALIELERTGKIITFESLVKKSFNLAPELFKLTYFPNCPDTLKFDRILRTLRKENLIVGHIKTSFQLTDKGRALAKVIKIEGIPAPTLSRAPEMRIVREIRSSQVYKDYKFSRKLPDSLILKNLLHLTAEASLSVLQTSLENAIFFARQINAKDVEDFLTECLQNIKKSSKLTKKNNK